MKKLIALAIISTMAFSVLSNAYDKAHAEVVNSANQYHDRIASL